MDTKEYLKTLFERRETDYDYSKTVYKNYTTKIEIGCKKHGSFWQNPGNHRSGHDCPKCKKEVHGKWNLLGKDKFLKELHDHQLKNDYSNFKYINSQTKGEIICPQHGPFWQTPNDHRCGSDCPKCGNIIVSNKIRKNFIALKKEYDKIHNNYYNYDDSEYINMHTPMEISCPKHGFFKQLPYHHRNGSGCPKCKNFISKPEIQVQEFLQKMNYNIITNSRNIIKPYELDIYIPSLNKAIEFNGNYWHYSKKHFIPGKHSEKSNLCHKNGIKLLHIREDLWIKNPEKMKHVIQKFLEDEK